MIILYALYIHTRHNNTQFKYVLTYTLEGLAPINQDWGGATLNKTVMKS